MTDRIVVSGRGLVTPIGVGLDENMKALKEGKTGTVFVPEWKELGRRDRHFRVGGHEPFVFLIENGAFDGVV